MRGGTALVVVLVLAEAVYAGPITITFSGSVTQVSIDDIYGDIAPGASIQGSFTYEYTSPDLVPGDPSAGSYTSTGPGYGMTLNAGGHVFNAFDSINIGIFNSIVDQYTVTAFGSAGSITLELFFQDNSGTVFSDGSLPLAAPPLALLTILDFHLQEVTGDFRETQVDGRITELSPASEVPEPATLFQLLISLLVIASFRRRFACLCHLPLSSRSQ